MRWILTFVMMALPIVASGQEAPALTTERDKFSYAMGIDFGKQLKARSGELDTALFLRALNEFMSGARTLLTESEVGNVLEQYQKEMMAKQAAAAKALGDKNKAEGDAFLAANKAKEGVVVLPNGIQYKILTAGTGKTPSIDDTVVCQYRGTLVDGKEFDSSYKRGQPVTFPVKGVIRGWTEVLQLMPVGSKWQVFIPPALAYGERAVGPDIGPNATLIFELELVAVK